MIYQGWPIITATNYSEQGKEFWTQQGIEDFYFFKIKDLEILQIPGTEKNNAANNLVNQLTEIIPEIIKRPDGREVFEVYHFTSKE